MLNKTDDSYAVWSLYTLGQLNVMYSLSLNGTGLNMHPESSEPKWNDILWMTNVVKYVQWFQLQRSPTNVKLLQLAARILQHWYSDDIKDYSLLCQLLSTFNKTSIYIPEEQFSC